MNKYQFKYMKEDHPKNKFALNSIHNVFCYLVHYNDLILGIHSFTNAACRPLIFTCVCLIRNFSLYKSYRKLFSMPDHFYLNSYRDRMYISQACFIMFISIQYILALFRIKKKLSLNCNHNRS